MKKIRKGSSILLCAILVLSTLIVGCQSNKKATSDNKKIKVAFVYEGPIGDTGWNYAQDQGRKYLAANMPNAEVTYVDNVPETADSEKVFTQLAQKGNKVIFGTTYGYMDYMVNVAKKFPNVVFMHCTGYKTSNNLGTYAGRDYEGRYLSGILAGKNTKSNVIGFVAPFSIPEIVRNIDAFTLGAQSVNPNVKVKVVYTNSWSDPATEKTATNSLIDAGADVLAMHLDSTTVMQAAQERGVYGIGFSSDMRSKAPKAVLGGSIWNWGPYYVKTVKAVANGTWKPGQYWGGIKDNAIVDIGPFGPMVKDDVKSLISKQRQNIIDNKLNVFEGPIYDQAGNLKVAKGQKLTDEQMLSINWFVKGVEGTISK
ncbi:purine-binding protein precursor [Clostridium ragsdalei P11]|uniref:Purine-binding protein n=1 Tax=Clostridium ragsdalei P11 TaxID=1353534 RepID=A0A1A6AS70_9CLOT|nr:BMP family ABC transporter substrate-binding protein [Clostridium ragsdalei]OBR92888.1 purine-binding protein precursor [Clostridium ragsdalei P11]